MAGQHAAHGAVLPHYVDSGVNVVTKANIDSSKMAGLPMIDNARIQRETDALLQRLDSRIPRHARTVSRLSGGQRQAVSIARALYWHAKVVIMDEPTGALAVMEREHVITLARRLAAEGVGVIYIGHNLIEILEVADRIAVMYRGRIVYVTQADKTDQQELIKYMTGFTQQ